MRKARDRGNMRRKGPPEERCRRLALHIRIRRNNELFDVASFAAIHELFELELFRTHAVNRREDAVENVINAFVTGFFERDHVERFFHDEDHAVITALRRTNWALRINRNHLARRAVAHALLEFFERTAQLLRLCLACAQEEERQPLRGFMADAGELAELLDQCADLWGKQRKHKIRVGVYMKFYLSSFGLGNRANELMGLMPKNKKICYIPNACDYTHVNIEKRNATNKNDMDALSGLGLHTEILDLKNYFGETKKLRKKMSELGGVFVRGGNTFILRQAMKLSGFDVIFHELLSKNDFLYAGYSAGICVLAKSLKSLQTVDDPTDMPYPELKETIWDGLGFLEYMILPHYNSDHPESADINKEIEFCITNKILFKALRDGEVIVIE